MNNSQEYLDQIYSLLLNQRIRCMVHPCTEEFRILSRLVELYKNYYIGRAEEIKSWLYENKEENMNSYFTHDIQEIDKYLAGIDNRSVTEDFTIISPSISKRFSGFMLQPTLIGAIELAEN
jgi:hypothetical protein